MAEQGAKPVSPTKEAIEGDIYYQFLDGKYHAHQVLKIDTFDGGEQIHHLKLFNPLDKKPAEGDIDAMTVFVWHAPFEPIKDAKFLGHRDITPLDLQGFHTYLKLTDFRRYLVETGLDLNRIIEKAKDAFLRGNSASEAREFEAAIACYDEAVEEYPFLYEAMDNKAFALMDLGRFEEAIDVFQSSLRIEPNNHVAVFSIGECWFKLGKYEEAATNFKAALELQPDHRLSSEWLARAEAKRKVG